MRLSPRASPPALAAARPAARHRCTSVARSGLQLRCEAARAQWPCCSRTLRRTGPRRAPHQPQALAGVVAGFLGSGVSLDEPRSVVQALLVLAGIVFVHELGHFSVARALRVHVTKFAVGFGPSLLTTTRGGIEYSLGIIPLGGYVAFPDDDPECPYPKDDPDLLRNRPVGQRAAVVSAGVVANAVTAMVLLTTQCLTVGQLESSLLPGVRVPSLLKHSPARDAGVRPGDVILSVGGVDVLPSASSVDRVVRLIAASGSEPLPFVLSRPGEAAPLLVSVVPDGGRLPNDGRIGVQLEPNSRVGHRVYTSFPAAVSAAAADFGRLANVVWSGFVQLATHFSETADQVSGPIAIVAVGAKVARGDPAGFFQFCSILNINLAIVNLLPLPALDGGFLVLLALEAARGKRLPVEAEQAIAGSGLLLLVSLGVVMLLRDTAKLTDMM